jgi:preprotein translocase subunit SecD
MDLSAKSLTRYGFILWLIAAIAIVCYLFTFQNGRIKLRPDRIKFGIDLVGGTYITLGVQTDKAIETELADKATNIAKKLETEHNIVPLSQTIEKNEARLKFDTSVAAQAAQGLIKRQEPDLTSSLEGEIVKISFKDAYAKKIADNAVKGNIEVLRTRLDSLGVGEIPISAQGDKNIIVELPDIDDPQKAKEMIGKPALLEVKLVEREGNSREEILDAYDGELPEGMIIVPGMEGAEGRGKRYYLVPAHTDLTGRLLKDAYTGFGGTMQSEVVVNFVFNPEGGEKFYDLTRKNFNRNIAMIVDGAVVSAPRVSTPIGASGYIHGNFTTESATELALLLKSGAFVAPVTFEEERRIGPSLGQESIRQGLIACLVGLLLLFIFSVVVYKVAGIFAVLALIFNLLLILLVLGWLKATLTLPGIAGMVLTIGMAIDASILIYERIKEELNSGTPTRKAVQTGFSDAMEVILDSNITTFIVGIVLYKFGSGPIQGFALTLMIGIIATLITGLFFLRSIFNFFLYTMGMQTVKI